jgi:hypothetical protein
VNRRDPLILVDSPELVASGVWPDRHPAQTPLWEVAENVQFAGGKVQRRVPNSLIPTGVGGNPITGIGQMQASNGVRWLWFALANEIYRWYGPAAEDIGALGIFQEDQSVTLDPSLFDFQPWGNWMIVNNSSGEVKIFKPGTPDTFDVLTGAPTDAVAFFKKRNQLLAVGHGTNKRLVSFSDADNIDGVDAWVSTPENLAGTIPLEELNTPTRAGCHFGPALAVFGENQMFQVSWVGPPFYYGQQKLLDGIGAVGKFAVCSDGRLVYGVSRNGCWKTDGMQYSYIDEVVLRDYLQQTVNWDQATKICVRKNDITGCIEFSFPTGASLVNDQGWAYDPRYGGWSPVPAFSAMESRALFKAPVQGLPTGELGLMFDNAALAGPLLLETKAMLIQRDNSALHIGALVDEIELFIHSVSKVQLQYGVAEFPEGPFSWCEPIEVVTGQITYQPHTRISGTYHKLRLSSYEDNWSLDLQGFALFGEAEGQKRDKA